MIDENEDDGHDDGDADRIMRWLLCMRPLAKWESKPFKNYHDDDADDDDDDYDDGDDDFVSQTH